MWLSKRLIVIYAASDFICVHTCACVYVTRTTLEPQSTRAQQRSKARGEEDTVMTTVPPPTQTCLSERSFTFYIGVAILP